MRRSSASWRSSAQDRQSLVSRRVRRREKWSAGRSPLLPNKVTSS